MKRILLCFAIAAALNTMAVAQTNPLVKYLPENASAIMDFDMIRLVSKIPGETFRQSAIYREMMKDPGMPFNTLFTAPQKMGIDFSTGLILTVSNSGEGEYTDPIVNLFAKLSNAETFTSSMKEMLKGKDTAIRVYGTNRILIPGEAGPAIAWNNEIVVFNISQSKQAGREINELYNDTTHINIDRSVTAIREKYKKIQREEIFNLLTPHPQNSFTTNTSLDALLQTPGDIKMWSNGSGNPMMGNKMFPFTDLLKKLRPFTGHNRTSIINFENGKIVSQSRSYIGKEMADVYKKYPVSPINTDLIKRLPEGKLFALMTTSFNSDMGKEMIAKSGLKEMIDSVKTKIPFDIGLLQNAFKNNALFAVIKSEEGAAVDSITKKMGGFQLVIALPIGDKTSFDKLRTTALQLWESVKENEKSEKMLKEFTPVIKYNDDMLVLSLSQATATSFLNNTGTRAVPDWVQSHTNYPIVMGISFQEIMPLLLGKKGKADESADKIAGMFDKMIIYGGNYENESLNSTMEFRFSNPDDNALKQLFEIINGVTEKKGDSPMSKDPKGPKTDKVTIEDVKTTAVQEDPGPPPPPPPVKPKTKTPVKKKN